MVGVQGKIVVVRNKVLLYRTSGKLLEVLNVVDLLLNFLLDTLCSIATHVDAGEKLISLREDIKPYLLEQVFKVIFHLVVVFICK